MRGAAAGRRSSRALVPCALTALVVAATLAGCGDQTSAPGSQPDAGGGRTSASASASATGADPAHAVASPGPLQRRLASADILIVLKTAIPQATVDAIRRTEGVTDVEVLSTAQIRVEDQLLTVAAVDPATYRRFTPRASAYSQVTWDRVAGGEVAVVPEQHHHLAEVAPDDMLQLGIADDSPAVHVGAYAPQIPSIDAVVNEKWGEELGMTAGNSLLISTGISSPQTVGKRLDEVTPTDASVVGLDVVAQRGLDPTAVQNAVLVGSVADAVGTYTYRVVGGSVVPDPAWVASHIVTETVPVLGRVTCNKAILPQLTAAMNDIVAQGLADQIHPGEYGGCYNPRFIAGSSTLSNHAFGLALDLNVPGNGRGTVGEMDRSVVRIFEYWGFAWGGHWHYTDPMHFELNRLVRPG